MLDNRIRFALAVGLIEWLLVGILFISGGRDDFPMLVLIIGVASAIQFWTLFGRWGRNTPLREAQQLFAAGQYQAAAAKLEALANQDVQPQTLLGNTYRQLGRLTESETLLRSMVESYPQNPFPLYGLGRTLLAKGEFAEAAQWIEKALAYKGRKAIMVDAALAHYLNGNSDAALQHAKRASRMLQLERYRVLMVNYLLHHLAQNDRALPMIQQFSDGLNFWQAEADRFSSTVYGKRLSAEIQQIEALIGRKKA